MIVTGCLVSRKYELQWEVQQVHQATYSTSWCTGVMPGCDCLVFGSVAVVLKHGHDEGDDQKGAHDDSSDALGLLCLLLGLVRADACSVITPRRICSAGTRGVQGPPASPVMSACAHNSPSRQAVLAATVGSAPL